MVTSDVVFAQGKEMQNNIHYEWSCRTLCLLTLLLAKKRVHKRTRLLQIMLVPFNLTAMLNQKHNLFNLQEAIPEVPFLSLEIRSLTSSIYLIRNKIIDQELETKPIQRCCSNRTKRDETLLVI